MTAFHRIDSAGQIGIQDQGTQQPGTVDVKGDSAMTIRKQTTAEREQSAAGKVPAASSGKRSSGKSRPRIAPTPVRASHTALAGNSFSLEAVPTLAGALAQSPVSFLTAVELPLPLGHAAERQADKQGKSAAGVRQKFGELREALAEGWEIVQPIFARPLWSVSDDSITAFNFVLRRECTTRLVTVPAGRTVQRFIRDRQLVVDYRR
jgi:hypothetical protein